MVIYEKYKLMLYRICFTYLKNVSDTEDCVQDTFVQLIRKEPYFDNADHEKAWLIRVASNICKNKLKHWWFSKKNNSQDDQLMGSHQLDVDETLMAIMTLPEKYKVVVYLYYYERYNSIELSKMLNKPPSTVRHYIH
ncbi:MAG TPA: RNA polymerase sigma factor [Candidatus Jeotgalibaca merdavium]|uniref:RNA polymerase sigma factor n=1 Tax=Candidatus Jeotgalibaca merdavium TaxID=2838627 RepID=A0A9D2KY81_9LACT|nr:RNA polymerase sigma factor [Candidatus Jeotgalibaca merdavium]